MIKRCFTINQNRTTEEFQSYEKLIKEGLFQAVEIFYPYDKTLEEQKEYCNKEFGATVVAVGLKGEDVKELPMIEAVSDLQRYHNHTPKSRTAIIYKKGKEQLIKEAVKTLSSEEYALDVVDNDKISIVTVETAKGLEFEKVVVITEDMTVNEKYISYTRALESLGVI